MGNLITKYEEFIFEADSINTEISNTKLEISKVEDELKAAKIKMLDSKKSSSGDEAKELLAESVYIGEQSQAYGKMIPLLNALKPQIDKKISELKG
jgi:formyltetrahydrofolate synthetase